MASKVDPVIGEWYHSTEKAEKFMVTAINDHSDTVEIQYFDGNVDEMDLSTWYGLDIEHIEAPEDWTGPMDNIEKDDLNPVGTEMQREDWEAPYQQVDESQRAGPRTSEEENQESEDEWIEEQP